MRSTVKISKIVGAGNDFLFIDSRTEPGAVLFGRSRPDLAMKLCDRHFGLGADGLVFVENSQSPGRLKWDFYNSDGSAAEMCGNATRCMGRWADVYMKKHEIELETVAGLVRTTAEARDVTAFLDYARVTFQTLTYVLPGAKAPLSATLVNTGVPHAVVEVSSIDDQPGLAPHIKALRFHENAGPKGANVTFLEVRGDTKFATVSFERGVEDFTLSCGTGVLAAAAVGLKRFGGDRASLSTPGGDLQVQFGKDWSGAVLKGPAKFLFETAVSKEFFE